MAADLYDVLGVDRSATAEDIKRAYRRLARELHPDANGGDPEAERRFKEVTAAYEVLRDPERRRQYDLFGHTARGAGPAGGDPFADSVTDLFDAFFGGASPFGGGRRGASGPPRGADLETILDLEFEEAVFGASREVEVRLPVPCSTCQGSGARPGTHPERCRECGGTGSVRRVRQSILGQMVTAGPCHRCGGLGEDIPHPCPDCRGEGRRTEERTYTVDVPAGVDHGTTLRLTGRGAAGARGGPAGDLYVHLRVRPHERFVRDGADLVAELHLTMAQAALGAHLVFPTLDADEDLVVPRGTQTGRVFRLRGRGVPRVDGRGRGDLLVRVVVDTPEDLTAEQEDLLRRFAAARGEDVAPEEEGFLGRIRSAFR